MFIFYLPTATFASYRLLSVMDVSQDISQIRRKLNEINNVVDDAVRVALDDLTRLERRLDDRSYHGETQSHANLTKSRKRGRLADESSGIVKTEPNEQEMALVPAVSSVSAVQSAVENLPVSTDHSPSSDPPTMQDGGQEHKRLRLRTPETRTSNISEGAPRTSPLQSSTTGGESCVERSTIPVPRMMSQIPRNHRPQPLQQLSPQQIMAMSVQVEQGSRHQQLGQQIMMARLRERFALYMQQRAMSGATSGTINSLDVDHLGLEYMKLLLQVIDWLQVTVGTLSADQLKPTHAALYRLLKDIDITQFGRFQGWIESKNLALQEQERRIAGQLARSPSQNIQTPSQSFQTLRQIVHTPSQSVQTPSQSVQTPDQNEQTPSQSAQTQGQSVQIQDQNVQTQDRSQE